MGSSNSPQAGSPVSTTLVMKTAVAPTACDLFFAQLSGASRRVLLLDYDGTLAPFSPDRTRAYPYPAIPELLDCIVTTCRTRLVLISGRAAREIPPLLGLNLHPEILGTHGLERLYPDGRYEVAPLNATVQQALAEAGVQLQEAGLEELTEIKPGAVAVHWRGLDTSWVEDVRSQAYRALSPMAFQPGLLLAEFDGGLELRARSRGKGDAVQTILSEIGDAPVAYLGDDTTDEEAFRALHGRGLSVLVRPIHRFTAAQMWLRPPAELEQFLVDWITACGGRCE